MVGNDSTPYPGQAKPPDSVPLRPPTTRAIMSRIFIIVFAAGLLLLAAGALLLGSFPPSPKMQSIEKTLPNDKFKGN